MTFNFFQQCFVVPIVQVLFTSLINCYFVLFDIIINGIVSVISFSDCLWKCNRFKVIIDIGKTSVLLLFVFYITYRFCPSYFVLLSSFVLS